MEAVDLKGLETQNYLPPLSTKILEAKIFLYRNVYSCVVLSGLDGNY